MTKAPLAQRLELLCPQCERSNTLSIEAFRQIIREFASTNLSCKHCHTWIRVDILVGHSHLQGYTPPDPVVHLKDGEEVAKPS